MPVCFMVLSGVVVVRFAFFVWSGGVVSRVNFYERDRCE